MYQINKKNDPVFLKINLLNENDFNLMKEKQSLSVNFIHFPAMV
jgi:hypothetical protein